jgi:hypothetical protein
MALLASRFSSMHCQLADQHAVRPLQPPRNPRRPSSLKATPPNTNGGSSSSRLAPPNKDSSSTISPARLLHTLEFSAIAIAAVGQAAILVSSAVSQWRQTQQIAELQDQLSSIGAEAAASTRQQHHRQQQHAGAGTGTQQQLLLQQEPAPGLHLHSGLHLVTGSALVVGLLCGAGLRQLQLR